MEPTQLGFEQSRTLLDAYGIPVLGRMVRTPEQAVVAAWDLGFPVAMKTVSSQIIHKTDLGCVLLGLADRPAVEQGFAQLMDNVRAAGVDEIDGILIQPMVTAGQEILIGATQDPSFGPMTMIGSGGRFVELLADVAPGIGILEERDVRAMLDRTMAGKILDGFRGPALDKDAVVRLAMSVSRFMAEHPEIHELDLNPVIVYEKGFAIVDARLIAGDPVLYPRQTDVPPQKMASLQTIFNPASVVLYGASNTGTVGGIVLKNLRRLQRVYPINPRTARASSTSRAASASSPRAAASAWN